MHTMKSKDIPNPEQPKSQSDFWREKNVQSGIHTVSLQRVNELR